MPAGDNSGTAVTQRPGQVPGTSVVTGANGEEVTVPNAVAENILSRPDFTSADVAGETSEQLADPAQAMAEALGQQRLEDMSDALAVSDELLQQYSEQERAQAESAPLAYGGYGALSGMLPEGSPEFVRDVVLSPGGPGGYFLAPEVGGYLGIPVPTRRPPTPGETEGRRAERGLLPEGQADIVSGADPSALTRLIEREEGLPEAQEEGSRAPSTQIRVGPDGLPIRVSGALPTPRRGRRGPIVETRMQRDFVIPGGDPELDARMREAQDKDVRLLQAIANNDARLADDVAGIHRSVAENLMNNRQELERLTASRMEAQREGLANLEALNDKVMRQQIDPTRFFSSRGGAARFGAAASVALGSLAQALAPGTQNAALTIIDTAIQRDIAAQVENLRNAQRGVTVQRGILQDLRLMYNDEIAAQQALRTMYITEAQRRIQGLMATTSSANQRIGAQRLMQELEVQRAESAAALAERIGSVRVIEDIRVRGNAASAAASRQLGRMVSPQARAAIDVVRAREGLPALQAAEQPTAGPPSDPRRVRRTEIRPSGGQLTTNTINDTSHGEANYMEHRGESVLASVETTPVRRSGQYVFVNPTTGEERLVRNAVRDGQALIRQGFRQRVTQRLMRNEPMSPEEMGIAEASIGGIPLGGNLLIPPENMALYQQIGGFGDQGATERTRQTTQIGRIARMKAIVLQILRRKRDGSPADIADRQALESLGTLGASEIFGESGLGTIQDAERDMLNSVIPNQLIPDSAAQVGERFIGYLNNLLRQNQVYGLAVDRRLYRGQRTPAPGSLRGGVR